MSSSGSKRSATESPGSAAAVSAANSSSAHSGSSRSRRMRHEVSDHARLKSTQDSRRAWSETSWHMRSEEHTSELQSHSDLVCRLLLEKKKKKKKESIKHQHKVYIMIH